MRVTFAFGHLVVSTAIREERTVRDHRSWPWVVASGTIGTTSRRRSARLGVVGNADLVRYWFTFDLRAIIPQPTRSVVLDGTFAYRFCDRGVGVTGDDERDRLRQLAAVLAPEPVPVVLHLDEGCGCVDVEPR
jgi:hypothetical protein